MKGWKKRSKGCGDVASFAVTELETALTSEIRAQYFPFSDLKENANVLIFPDLQSGNLAMHLLHRMGEAVVVGPVLMGTRLPAHLVQYNSTVEDLVNLTTTGIVLAAAPQGSPTESAPRLSITSLQKV